MKLKIIVAALSIVVLGCKKDSYSNQWIKDEAKSIRININNWTDVTAYEVGRRDGNVYFNLTCDTCSANYLLEVDGNLNAYNLTRTPFKESRDAFFFNGHHIRRTTSGSQITSDSAATPLSGWINIGELSTTCQWAYFYGEYTEYVTREWEEFQFEFVRGAPFSHKISGTKEGALTASLDGSTMLYTCYDTLITGVKALRDVNGTYQDTLLNYQPERGVSIYLYNNTGQLKQEARGLSVQSGSDGFFVEEPIAYPFNLGYYLVYDSQINVYDKNWNLKNTIEHPSTGSCIETISKVHAFQNGLNILSVDNSNGGAPNYLSTQLKGFNSLRQITPSDIYNFSEGFCYEDGEVITRNSKSSSTGSTIYNVHSEPLGSQFSFRSLNIIPSYQGYFLLLFDRYNHKLIMAKSDERGRVDKIW